MVRLPAVSSRALIRFLESKGFVVRRTSGSHCILRNERALARAVVPIHTGDLPKGTVLAILRESQLSKSDLAVFLGQSV